MDKQYLCWLAVVASACAASADVWREDGVVIRRVMGGANNAIYRVEAEGQCYACKLCVADERRRAAHEYHSLRVLRAAGLDVAPKPLWLDESCRIVPLPVVVYCWLPGVTLKPPLESEQLAALLASVQRIHALQPLDHPGGLSDSWFHWFDYGLYLAELGDFARAYGPWLADEAQDLHRRLLDLIDVCTRVVAASRASPGREQIAVRMCRVDANLANTVWAANGRLRWIDWEYSGWGDPALDLADFYWHAALEDVGTAQLNWLRANYQRPPDDAEFDRRLLVWDHIIATRWAFLVLRLLWSQYNGPDRVRLSQPAVDTPELWGRLTRFIERAEGFVQQTEKGTIPGAPAD